MDLLHLFLEFFFVHMCQTKSPAPTSTQKGPNRFDKEKMNRYFYVVIKFAIPKPKNLIKGLA